jgi:two-component sensor histidine kinase/tetratricopeptide (TPR) repeat protein
MYNLILIRKSLWEQLLLQFIEMKKVLLILLLGFHALFSEAQNVRNSHVSVDELIRKSRRFISVTPFNPDSALIYAEKAEQLGVNTRSRLLGDVYLLKTEIFTQRKQPGKGQIQAQKAIEYFRINGPETRLAEAYMQLAVNYPQYDTALTARIQLYGMAAQLFRNGKDTLNEALALRNLAYDQFTNGNLDTALTNLKKCLCLYRAKGYKNTQEIYSRMSSIYTQKGVYAEALRYGLQAVRLVEQVKDSSVTAAEIYNYLAITYGKLNQNNKIEEYLRKAFAIARKNTDIDLILALAANIGELLIIQNKPAEGLRFLTDIRRKYPPSPTPYIQLQLAGRMLSMAVKTKDYNKARIYCKELKAASAQVPEDGYDQLLAYPYLIEYYMALYQYDSARKYLEPYYRLVQDAGMLTGIRDIHKSWFKIDSASGNYRSAIRHLNLVRYYSDSIYNRNKASEISAIQVQYETEKKEKDIQLLTKQGLLQQTRLQQTTFSRNVTLTGIILSLFFVGLLYNRYRLKQRINKQLQLQQLEINEKNESLQHLLTEKEWLLKEVHHRIKNNLQMVISLLNSQSAYLENDAALSALEVSRHRIHAMSLIHQRLYTTDNISVIDMPAYIRELINYMQDSFGTSRQIRFEVDIMPLKLDIAHSVPLGLILNEAITNALKYAFPGERQGIIKISLNHQALNRYLLTIADDGIGMPPDVDQKIGSLGMSLMKGLSEDLDGSLDILSENGTTISISFLYDTAIKDTSTADVLSDDKNETI